MAFGGFRRFFEELGFFGVRQMIPWVILLQMHPLTALCDPFGSCYDKVPSLAVRIAEGGRQGVRGGGGRPPRSVRHGTINCG